MIPEVFEGHFGGTEYEPIKNLRVLKLSNNLIHMLKKDLFEHFPSIEELDLHENPFTVIDSQTLIAISELQKLRVLDMSAMQLTKLPEDMFHAIRTLEVLDLSENGLHHVPEALQYAINLKELTLDNNPINNLEYVK